MPETPKANRGPSAGPGNRAAIVTAARSVFAELGYTAPLSAVAREAGVGQGSLYRHFPDRIALAVAVFDDNLVDLETVAADPATTVESLLARVAEQITVAAGLVELILTEHHDDRVAGFQERLTATVEAVLDRDRAAGRVPERITTEDVVLAAAMLAATLPRIAAADRDSAAARALALFSAAFAPTREG